ncbi:MAG: lipoprotein [Lachnospiraceae bacterium]|nr:lipoprotein [Lachnospiraceae bacterium]
MKKLFILFLSATLLLSGCSIGDLKKQIGMSDTSENAGVPRETVHDFNMPEAPGTTVYGNSAISIDASNTADGYVMIRYGGSAPKVQVQIHNPDGTEYDYPLEISDYHALPLTGGNGTYQIDVLENVTEDMYSVGLSQKVRVELADEFRPYLFPNQYVNYTADSEAVQKGVELSDDSTDDISFITNVYNWVIKNISYDTDLASNVTVNYIPSVDATYASKKGICFDYASLMSAMLRSQDIPTKLVVGYSGTAYHAWISVYLEGKGWVDDIIEFNGSDWSLMDPTLAANNANNDSAVKEYVGDGSNYTAKYTY